MSYPEHSLGISYVCKGTVATYFIAPTDRVVCNYIFVFLFTNMISKFLGNFSVLQDNSMIYFLLCFFLANFFFFFFFLHKSFHLHLFSGVKLKLILFTMFRGEKRICWPRSIFCISYWRCRAIFLPNEIISPNLNIIIGWFSVKIKEAIIICRYSVTYLLFVCVQ